MLRMRFKRVQPIELTVSEQQVQLPSTAVDALKIHSVLEEKQTQPQKQALHKTVTMPIKASRRSVWVYIAVIIVTGACAYGGVNLSRLGMDWGYYTVGGLVGQPAGNDQCTGCFILSLCVAPAIYSSMAVSTLKRLLAGSRCWDWFLPPVAILSQFILVFGQSTDFLTYLPYCFGACFGAIAFSLGFDRLYCELAKHTDVKRLLASQLIAVLACTLLLHILYDNGLIDGSLREALIYCGLLSASAFWAPLSIRANRQDASFSAMFFASFPVLIFNVINIVFATVCGIVGKSIGLDLGWQALFSASLISLAAGASLALGAAFGCLVSSRLRRIHA